MRISFLLENFFSGMVISPLLLPTQTRHFETLTGSVQMIHSPIKCGCPAIESLQVLATEEEIAVYDRILSETKHTIHLLGIKRVVANVEKKLEELHFPSTQITDDNFRGPRTVPSGSLCECKSNEEFYNKVSEMKRALGRN